MVAGDEAPQTVLVGGLVGRQVIVQEFVNAGAGVLQKYALPMLCGFESIAPS